MISVLTKMKKCLLFAALALVTLPAIADENKLSHDIVPAGALWLQVIGSKDDGPYYARDSKSGLTYRVWSTAANQKQGEYLYGYFFKVAASKKKANEFPLLMQLEIIDQHFGHGYAPDIADRRLRFWTGYKSLMGEYKKLPAREIVEKVEELTASGGKIYWEKVLQPHLLRDN